MISTVVVGCRHSDGSARRRELQAVPTRVGGGFARPFASPVKCHVATLVRFQVDAPGVAPLLDPLEIGLRLFI